MLYINLPHSITTMPKYDLQDPTDLDIMRGQFDMYTTEDWQEYIELAEERSIGYKLSLIHI